MKTEPDDGQVRATSQLPADEKDERQDGQCHGEGKPLEYAVSPSRRGSKLYRRPLDWRSCVGDHFHSVMLPISLDLDLVYSLQHAITQRVRQRSIGQLFRHRLASGQCPFQKLDQLLALGRILLLFINQQPCRTGDWIRILARGVRDGKAKVVWNLGRGHGSCN